MNFAEEWMILPRFSNYFISNRGSIKRIRKIKRRNGIVIKEIILKLRIINGYQACTLVRDDGIKKTVYIHKAIATCFVNKPVSKQKLVVVHRDSDKTNNNIDNLAWKTFSEFMNLEFISGRRSNKDLWAKRVQKYGPNGCLNPPVRRFNISNKDLENIYSSYHQKKYTLKKLALIYNCSISHIYNLLQKQKKVKEAAKAERI